MLEYWATHESPRSGIVTSAETKERQRVAQKARVPLGTCFMCEGALYSIEAAERKIGDDCLKRGLAEGYLRENEDGTYSYFEDEDVIN